MYGVHNKIIHCRLFITQERYSVDKHGQTGELEFKHGRHIIFSSIKGVQIDQCTDIIL